MLPEALPVNPAYSGKASMVPAREMGGDFYDFFPLDERRLGLVIADVSGKGVPAAFFMAISRTVLQQSALDGGSAGACLARANAPLCARNPMELFVTAFYGILDVETGDLSYANGGHNPPLMVRHADGTVAELPRTGGMALGVMTGMAYAEAAVRLTPGDTLFLYTDGISEAMDGEGPRVRRRAHRGDLARLGAAARRDRAHLRDGRRQCLRRRCAAIRRHHPASSCAISASPSRRSRAERHGASVRRRTRWIRHRRRCRYHRRLPVRRRALRLRRAAGQCACLPLPDGAKAVGGPFAVICPVLKTSFRVTRGTLSVPELGTGATGLLRRLRLPMIFDYPDYPDIGVLVGCFDEPDRVPPVVQYGNESRVDWYGSLSALPGDHPTYAVDPLGYAAESRRATDSIPTMTPMSGRPPNASRLVSADALDRFGARWRHVEDAQEAADLEHVADIGLEAGQHQRPRGLLHALGDDEDDQARRWRYSRAGEVDHDASRCRREPRQQAGFHRSRVGAVETAEEIDDGGRIEALERNVHHNSRLS